MTKVVTLRQAGHSKVLTAPNSFDLKVGTKYKVEIRADDSIVYEPLKRKNIFEDPEWQHYDYQKDLLEDPELQSLDPVGNERLDN